MASLCYTLRRTQRHVRWQSFLYNITRPFCVFAQKTRTMAAVVESSETGQPSAATWEPPKWWPVDNSGQTAGAAERCGPCSSLDPSAILSNEAIESEIKRVPLYELADGGKKLTRSFIAKNFQAALDFLAAAGAIAEREGHHPDFHLTNYREVEVVIFTHKVGGLTLNDFVLARKLNAAPIEYSPKWAREHGLVTDAKVEDASGSVKEME